MLRQRKPEYKSPWVILGLLSPMSTTYLLMNNPTSGNICDKNHPLYGTLSTRAKKALE
jgi:hypothetical protein